MCSSDGQRLYEAVSVGCLLVGGPLVGILGLSYTAYFLGPTALIGCAIFIIFYPTMVKLTLMSVIKCMSSVSFGKLLKLYASVKMLDHRHLK